MNTRRTIAVDVGTAGPVSQWRTLCARHAELVAEHPDTIIDLDAGSARPDIGVVAHTHLEVGRWLAADRHGRRSMRRPTRAERAAARTFILRFLGYR